MVSTTTGALAQSDKRIPMVDIPSTDKLLRVNSDGSRMYLESGLVLNVPMDYQEMAAKLPRPAAVRLQSRPLPQFPSVQGVTVTLVRNNRGSVLAWVDLNQQRTITDSRQTQTNSQPKETQANQSAPSTPWFYWSVCTEPKAIGASAAGDKVYCNKCTGPSIAFSNNPGIYCYNFESRQAAKDFMTIYCDCP